MNLSFFAKIIPYFGLCGSVVILSGCLAAGLVYVGKEGEPYSLFNHFISELGEKGVSKAAGIYNTCLSTGGVLFIPLIFFLGVQLNSWWAVLATTTGLLAAISVLLIGIYSMDRLTPHRKAAMTFFRSGLLTVIFFVVAVFVQPADSRKIPLSVNLFGIIAILSYVVFLILVSHKTDKNDRQNYILDPSHMPVRPTFWRTAFMEWMLFLSTMGWFLAASLILIFR